MMKLKKEVDKVKEIEKNKDKEKLIYETDEYTYSFKNFQTIKTFGRDIYEGKITIKEADEYQADSLTEIMSFSFKYENQDVKKKSKKKLLLITYIIFLRVEKKLLMLLKAKYFR